MVPNAAKVASRAPSTAALSVTSTLSASTSGPISWAVFSASAIS
ncbi:hypothetical protein ACVILH_004195 [Bradyrhizobium sp. USDA 4353]